MYKLDLYSKPHRRYNPLTGEWVWPFETMLLPKRYMLHLPDVSQEERETLADILKNVLVRYDNLFQVSFPYTMAWHGTPFDGNINEQATDRLRQLPETHFKNRN